MPVKILMADDSTTIQKVIRIALSSYSIVIDEVKNSAELSTYLKHNHYHLLLVDSNLTGIDHLQDLSHIIAINKNIPSIILKGSFDPHNTQDFNKHNLPFVLKKPFSTQELINAIEKIGLKLKKKSYTTNKKEQEISSNNANTTANNIKDDLSLPLTSETTNSASQDKEKSPTITKEEISNKFKTCIKQLIIDEKGQFHREIKEIVNQIAKEQLPRIIETYCA